MLALHDSEADGFGAGCVRCRLQQQQPSCDVVCKLVLLYRGSSWVGYPLSYLHNLRCLARCVTYLTEKLAEKLARGRWR